MLLGLISADHLIPVNSAMQLNGIDDEDGSLQRLSIRCKIGE